MMQLYFVTKIDARFMRETNEKKKKDREAIATKPSYPEFQNEKMKKKSNKMREKLKTLHLPALLQTKQFF